MSKLDEQFLDEKINLYYAMISELQELTFMDKYPEVIEYLDISYKGYISKLKENNIHEN